MFTNRIKYVTNLVYRNFHQTSHMLLMRSKLTRSVS